MPTAQELVLLKLKQELNTERLQPEVIKVSAHSAGIPFSGSRQTVSLELHLGCLEGHLAWQHAMVLVPNPKLTVIVTCNISKFSYIQIPWILITLNIKFLHVGITCVYLHILLCISFIANLLTSMPIITTSYMCILCCIL